ncbi:LrgB family protein [Ruania suaedae]|uniref:LrgB family protein n=1 Tax=Ruania suaedae TaxID=2897774 RepID=UPI001E34C69A|nr:LrgB family protein [Ruania suaedae]UFU01813.1 LrgB family protein [Ruania suaedae]
MTGLASMLVWTASTVLAYLGALWLYRRSGRHPVLSPVVTATVVLTLALEVTGTAYPDYLAAVAPVTIGLALATVALAVPLHTASGALLPLWPRLLLTFLCAAALALVLAALPLVVAGAPEVVRASALPLSVTTPVTVEISALVGGDPSLAAGLAICSGILGAVLAPRLLTLVGVRDPRARGIAIGVTSHGIGTSRVLLDEPETGAWSSAAMVVHALVMTAAVPVVAGVL